MRGLLLAISFAFLWGSVYSQTPKYVYTIKADTVKITNCDSAELVLMNHTQGVPGFLFNTGNGRTQFQHGLISLGNGSYQIGADTLNAWVQGGNKFGATGVFGTLDNNPVNFYANNAQWMSLQTNGHLLINTTSDDGHDNLQVGGNIYSSGYLTNTTTQLGSGTAGGSIRLRWGTSDGGIMSFYNQGNSNVRTIIGSASDGRPLYLFDSIGFSFLYTPWVAIGGENGSLSKLTVVNSIGSSLYDLALTRTNTDSGVWDFAVMPPGVVHYGNFVDNGTIMQLDGTAAIGGSVGIGVFFPTAQLHTTGSVRFAGLTVDSTQTNVVVADNNGNLYTRSASSLAAADFPRSSLAVNGTIKAKNLTLHPSGWADYVFDSSYRLPPLAAVESYIRSEHHLPDMPAAAAVAKDGIDVGENQAKLLKKVEELTLYTIKQDHEIEDLKKQVEELKKMITSK